MAAASRSSHGTVEKESILRGHHESKAIWTPVIGEELVNSRPGLYSSPGLYSCNTMFRPGFYLSPGLYLSPASIWTNTVFIYLGLQLGMQEGVAPCDMHAIPCKLDEHWENGSFSMVTRTENFAVLQVRRSEKVHYKFKHIQQWYFLTSTVDEQCHVHLNEMTVPKDGSTVNIIFEEKKYKELELFNPQWISNYSLLEKVTVEKAFEKHFFHLRDIEKRMFPPQEPTVDAFREELESFMKCARHIASYHST